MAKLVLELDLEPGLIEKIKASATASSESLVAYTERLLIKDVEALSEAEAALPDWIKKLTIAKTPTPDFDAKKVYGDYILNKYSI